MRTSIAEPVFVIGANMADCHPILFLRMMDRVKAGAKLIVVDPRRSATADKAEPVPADQTRHRSGVAQRPAAPAGEKMATPTRTSSPRSPKAGRPCPVSSKIIRRTRRADHRPGRSRHSSGRTMDRRGAEWMSCWTMGLNQSTHGTWNTNALCNLHLATGAICRPGSGPFSLTGQPNAMGGREMGYMGPGLPGQRSVLVEADRAFIEDLWNIPHDSLPALGGAAPWRCSNKCATGQIKACWIICTNPVASVPNRQHSD
jgi:sulfite reductase (NADPH) flavoprotein alpha-component